MPSTTPSPFPPRETSTTLKTLLSRTATQQSLLGGLHPTARAAPLLAFAAAGLIQRRTGVDVLDSLLGGEAMTELAAPGVSANEDAKGSRNGSRIWESCRTCSASTSESRNGGNANGTTNMLRWLLDDSGL